MRKKADRAPRESQLSSGWIVEGAPAEEPMPAPVPETLVTVAADDAGPAEGSADEALAGRPQLSNGAVVLLGVIGGLYLLYAWVWLSWANYYAQVNDAVAATSGVLGGVLQQVVFWLAPLAPALWFLAAYLMNRHASTWRLAVWLLAGAVVLVPLPALITGSGS